MLALSVLGAGHTGFSPGADGGRDGYFEGVAPYPSAENKWSGTWYIQSKFHKQHLSKDPQKWLLEQIKAEIKSFTKPGNHRKWPDNYILATNIDPTGAAKTGTFDKARALICKARPKLKNRFHIWGGQKIVDLLSQHPNVREQYDHFLTPGHVISALYQSLSDAQSSVKDIIRYLVIKEFETHQFTKLDQAGSEADTRPGVHKLFVDLPYRCKQSGCDGLVAEDLFNTSKRNHKPGKTPTSQKWAEWEKHPTRAKIWFIQGGPGQGKSTSGQYFAQIQRAALILDWDGDPIHQKFVEAAADIRKESSTRGHWHDLGRIPIAVDLKEYAQWFGKQPQELSRGVLQFVTSKISRYTGKTTSPETLKRALRNQSWFIAFDGLDEVPNDVKDALSSQIKDFINDTSFECNSDAHFICTSRPQGYSGQFDDLDCAFIRLAELTAEKALECAIPVIQIGRTELEAEKGISILKSAIKSPAVRALMTTPLQSHIMAVVVRDGKKPPERRWQLFENFYQVIKRRETNRDLPDRKLAKLLREEEQLLRSIHNKLGFVLHAKAELSTGAQTSLSRADFEVLAHDAVSRMKDSAIDETVGSLMEATSTRLVLLNTPDDGGNLRFDIRQLQEFFAAEYIHDAVDQDTFRTRVASIAGDSHWREVMHFLLSAMIEPRRITEIGELACILEQLNTGRDENDHRALKRRLGRGALLAARLLQDGVLEQDKQIRFRFRASIEPLMASLDTIDLELLTTIDHPQSRKWVIDYSLERLREGDNNETIGAAYILTRLLQKGDPSIVETLILLKAQPAAFKSELFRKWLSGRTQDDEIRPSAWVTQFAIEELISSNWDKLDDDSLQAAIYLSKQLVDFTEESLLLPNYDFINIVVRLLRLDSEGQLGDQLVNYGFIAISRMRNSWINGKYSNKELDTTEPVTVYIYQQLGFLQVVYNLFVFSKTHSVGAYRMLRSVIDAQPGRLERILPHHLHPYIPPSFDIALTNLTNEALAHAIASAEAPTGFDMIDPVKFSLEAVTPLLEARPEIGVRMLVEGWFRPMNIVGAKEATELLASKVLTNTALLGYINILHWGHFTDIESLQASTSDATIKQLATSLGGGISRFIDIYPLKLNSEKHPYLMPPVLIALLSLSESSNHATWDSHSTAKEFDVREICRQLELFFPFESPKVKYVGDDYIDGFLALFSILHPKIEKDLNSLHTDLVKSIAVTKNAKLLQSILHYVSAHLPKRSEEFDSMVNNLLEACRANLRLREMFTPLLRQWREISCAPVSSVENIAAW